MKKLKLEKLKLNDLSAGDQKNVLGGNVQPASWVTTTTISIASYLINSCIECTDTLQNGCFIRILVDYALRIIDAISYLN